MRNNDKMSRNHEREEYLQRQEEAWREKEKNRKAQEEGEEQNKNLKLTLILIRRKKFLNINKLQNPQWSTQRNKNVSIRHTIISIFFLIPRPLMTCWKHFRMTHLIKVKGKNQSTQCCRLINHTHFRLKVGLIMKKHP